MNLTNQFLIAMPSLADPNFAKTVTYILAHNADGAMGLVINRPLKVRFEELLGHMQITATSTQAQDTCIVQGGPVEPQRGFVIHEPCGEWDATLVVDDGLAVAWSRDILSAMGDGLGPGKAIVALGYAGWGAGQLEAEVLANAWLSGPSDAEIIFDYPFAQRWQAAAKLMGVDVDRLSDTAGHA